MPRVAVDLNQNHNSTYISLGNVSGLAERPLLHPDEDAAR